MRPARALAVLVRVAMALRMLVSFTLALPNGFTRGYDPIDDKRSADMWACASYDFDHDRCPEVEAEDPDALCSVHKGMPIVQALRRRA